MRATPLLLLSTLLVREVSAIMLVPPLRPPTVVRVDSTYKTPEEFHTTLRELKWHIMRLMREYKDRASAERSDAMLKQLEELLNSVARQVTNR